MQEIKNLTDYKLSLRERIETVAVQAFAEHGIKATKMDDIAAQLAISKRTLYELYDTKELLLFECIRRHNSMRNQELSSFAADSRHDVVDIIVYFYRKSIAKMAVVKPTFYEELTKYPQIVDYLEEQKQRNHDDFLRFIQRGVKEGYFRSDLNYDIISHIFEALGHYMQHKRLYEQFSFEELFFNMLFVTLRGFCTPKGIDKLDRAISKDFA